MYDAYICKARVLITPPKTKQVEIKHPPIFILGHYRSGTSLLHELLDRDENVRALGCLIVWVYTYICARSF